ncbi:MAG: hypothetical protein E6I21_07750 [Chloroflexi bacterium]|nr:MAG: hypothetical protein E6I21_07750 [Chloroflexota bacterium]
MDLVRKGLDMSDWPSYAPAMGAWALPLALVILSVICVVMGLFGAESRPGFAGARSSYKERWFPHSKND